MTQTGLLVPQVANVSVTLLVPSDFNPNAMNEEAFDELVMSMSDVGMVESIQVAPIALMPEAFRVKHPDKKYVIIGGEHRYRAASLLDAEAKIPVVIWDRDVIERLLGETIGELTDDKIKALLMAWTVRMNLIKGKMDVRKTTAMYGVVKGALGTDQARRQMGMTSDRAFAKIVRDAKKALPPEMAEKLEAMSGEIDNEAALSTAIQTLMATFGSDLKHGFMFFSFGGKVHLMVDMTPKLRAMMDTVVDHCRARDLNVNRVMASIMIHGWKLVEESGETVAANVLVEETDESGSA